MGTYRIYYYYHYYYYYTQTTKSNRRKINSMEETVKEFEARTECNLIQGLQVQSVGVTRT